MRIGYGWVSTRDQHPEAQHDAFTAAGCDEVFVDKSSGTLARRPGLDKALLSANRTGDQLVVTKLDRLGRSLENLIELSKQLQAKQIDLVVLNQRIDTSTAVGLLAAAVCLSVDMSVGVTGAGPSSGAALARSRCIPRQPCHDDPPAFTATIAPASW